MTILRNALLLTLLVSAGVKSQQVISFDGTEVYSEEFGDGDTTLLFIHGWNLDHSFWEHQVDFFRDDYHVVTLDLPGYGQSGKARSAWTIDAYGKDIQAIIKVYDLENVILVAHSMGGNIALEAIDEDPSRIIALIGVDNFKEVGNVPDSATRAEMNIFYEFLRQDYPNHVRSASEGFMFSPDSPPAPKETILNAYASADPDIAIALIQAAYSESENEAQLIEKLDIPFLLISATLIPVNEEGIKTHYGGPFFRNYQVDRSGHFPMFERPEEFNLTLRQALSEIGEDRN